MSKTMATWLFLKIIVLNFESKIYEKFKKGWKTKPWKNPVLKSFCLLNSLVNARFCKNLIGWNTFPIQLPTSKESFQIIEILGRYFKIVHRVDFNQTLQIKVRFRSPNFYFRNSKSWFWNLIFQLRSSKFQFRSPRF